MARINNYGCLGVKQKKQYLRGSAGITNTFVWSSIINHQSSSVYYYCVHCVYCVCLHKIKFTFVCLFVCCSLNCYFLMGTYFAQQQQQVWFRFGLVWFGLAFLIWGIFLFLGRSSRVFLVKLPGGKKTTFHT